MVLFYLLQYSSNVCNRLIGDTCSRINWVPYGASVQRENNK